MLRDLTMLSLPLHNHEVGNELFTNTGRFFAHLEMSYDHIDVITYTFGRTPLTRIRRVIFNILCEEAAAKYPSEMRINTNIHTKAYLCYVNTKLVNVFAGSLNCRYGFNYNMMFRLDKSLHKPMKEYFKVMWEHSKRFTLAKQFVPIRANASNVTATNNKTKKHKKTYGSP